MKKFNKKAEITSKEIVTFLIYLAIIIAVGAAITIVIMNFA